MTQKWRILFYGDSNTYGYDPADWTEGRYPKNLRWTEIVSKALSEKWEIREEGLNGRRIPDLRFSENLLVSLLEWTGEGGLFARCWAPMTSCVASSRTLAQP